MHDATAAADADLAAEHRGGRHVGLGVDGRSHVQVSYPHQPNVHPTREYCTLPPLPLPLPLQSGGACAAGAVYWSPKKRRTRADLRARTRKNGSENTI